MEKQVTLIKQRLERHQSDLLTPIHEAISQLAKGAEIMTTSAALIQLRLSTPQKINDEM